MAHQWRAVAASGSQALVGVSIVEETQALMESLRWKGVELWRRERKW